MIPQDLIIHQTTVQDCSDEASPIRRKAKPRRSARQCEYDGCEEWAWARGYCGSHYQKMRNDGKLPTVRIMCTPVERFHVSYRINAISGCWEWAGWIHPNGYGILLIGVERKKIRAHRFSWELHRGPIPPGILVLHKCDNRKCCNPDHLFLGTHQDNALDCVAKGRHSSGKANAKPWITPVIALNIRIMFARGEHSMPVLAKIYGVSLQTILGILRGGAHLKTG